MQIKQIGGGGGWGGQVGCKRRIEVIVKIQKDIKKPGGQVRDWGVEGGGGWSRGRGFVGSKVGGRG